MSIENEIASLTQSTTGLLTAVNTKKAILDTAVTNAEAAATDSTAQAVTSTSAKNSSEAARDAAVVAKNAANTSALNAASVVTGGTATVAPEAGKIPLADSEGKIDADWLPAEIIGRNVFAEDQAEGNSKYAASGFVHMGKHYGFAGNNYLNQAVSVNEGLWTHPSTGKAEVLHFGRRDDDGEGTSKEAYPSINIAGIETVLDFYEGQGNNPNDYGGGVIKFPDAPNATVTFDTATGSIVDYTTDTDPNYGDVASTTNEAVARVFEGHCANGDFRNSTSDWSTPTGRGTFAVTNNVATITNTQSTDPAMYIRSVIQGSGSNLVIGQTYRMKFNIIDINAGTVVYVFSGNNLTPTTTQPVAGDVFDFTFTATVISSPQIQINVANSNITSGDEWVSISNVSITPITESVVTERVDMYGLEAFLEEITTGNPYVYPNGLIQSQVASMDGIFTGSSNRPATYYAVFDGDTGSVGKGVDFFNASNANKVKMFSNPKNNLYWIGGNLYQWRVRQRTIAGAGNGDWEGINSTEGGVFKYTSNSQVQLQGKNNYKSSYTSGYAGIYALNSKHNNINSEDYALFRVEEGNNSASDLKGQCYFLVLGTISRLNPGAFHPNLNPMGTMRRWRGSGNGSVSMWYNTTVLGAKLLEKKDCFNYASTFNVDGGVVAQNGYSGVGATDAYNGRTDKRWSDAIYASGQGGVVDYRLSAWDKSSAEEASKVDVMVKNGTYRGVEKLKFTKIVALTNISRWKSGVNWTIINPKDTELLGLNIPVALNTSDATAIGKCKYVDNTGAVFDVVGKYTSGVSDYIIFVANGAEVQISGTGYLIYEDSILSDITSVSGEFTQTDIIGNPADILANPHLKDGWMGSWVPELPRSTIAPFSLNRKALVFLNGKRTTDNGINYGGVTGNFNSISNTTLESYIPAGHTCMFDYTAFAKQTKVANNATVFNGEAGVGSVFATVTAQTNRGCLLGESLIGRALTGAGYKADSLPLLNLTYDQPTNKLLATSWGFPLHQSITMTSGYGLFGFKALDYQVEDNQQLSINFAYEEIIHTTGFGDNNLMFISDSQTTNTDDNGNIVLTGTNTLAIPYGWSKNNT